MFSFWKSNAAPPHIISRGSSYPKKEEKTGVYALWAQGKMGENINKLVIEK